MSDIGAVARRAKRHVHFHGRLVHAEEAIEVGNMVLGSIPMTPVKKAGKNRFAHAGVLHHFKVNTDGNRTYRRTDPGLGVRNGSLSETCSLNARRAGWSFDNSRTGLGFQKFGQKHASPKKFQTPFVAQKCRGAQGGLCADVLHQTIAGQRFGARGHSQTQRCGCI